MTTSVPCHRSLTCAIQVGQCWSRRLSRSRRAPAPHAPACHSIRSAQVSGSEWAVLDGKGQQPSGTPFLLDSVLPPTRSRRQDGTRASGARWTADRRESWPLGRLLCGRLGGTVSTQHPLWRGRVRATAALGVWSRLAHGRARPGEAVSMWRDRALRWCRLSWVDVAWVGFVGVNLAAMRLLPAWQTVPFLAIWVSLTASYGFRLWRLQPT